MRWWLRTGLVGAAVVVVPLALLNVRVWQGFNAYYYPGSDNSPSSSYWLPGILAAYFLAVAATGRWRLLSRGKK